MMKTRRSKLADRDGAANDIRGNFLKGVGGQCKDRSLNKLANEKDHFSM